MNNRIKSILAIGCLLLSGVPAFGVACFPGDIIYEQPDGSKIRVKLNGDEHCHWYSDMSGRTLMPLGDGKLVIADETFKAKLARKRVEKATPASAYTKFPTTGRQKVLIILVEYSDKHFTYSADDFQEMLCSPGYSAYGAAGSAYDYFLENSAGRFIPEFDVYGPVELSHPMSYYGSNDDALAHEMISEACRKLDPEVDFSQYDRDGDGWADNVYVFYAGYGEADGGGANSVWPHSANIFNKGERLMLDGVNIGSYSCSNELIGGSSRLVGIGTFCHEFSHVLGLPDLYSTNNNTAFTPYYYSLMDHGNYNGDGRCPCALTAYERYFLGWCEPRELSTDGSVRLEPISSNVAYRLSLPGYNEEYYLLENRMKTGWDAQLPGEGLLIWHIDYSRDVWDRNAVNNDEARQRVNLIEADGIETLASSAGDPFPGSSKISDFSAFVDHTGTKYSHSLSNIKLESDVVTFDFNSPSAFPNLVEGLTADEVDDNEFSLKWNGMEEAESYLVSVSSVDNGRERPLASYTAVEVGEPNIRLKGLEPETDYLCRVRSVKGVSLSAFGEPIKVTTAEPGIGYFSPTALEAADINGSGFTARWETMDQAEFYLLDLYVFSEEASEKEEMGFSSPLVMPEGWTCTASGTMSVNGYYATSAPSLRFSQNAEILESPVYENEISSVSFWVRGYKADASAKVVLSAYTGGKWADVLTVTDIDNAHGEVKEWIPTDGKKGPVAIRLSYYGPSGSSVCIDDVTVNFGVSLAKKCVREKENVGSDTSYALSGLDSGKEYSYVVYGKKGEKLSLPSQEIRVTTLAGATGIETIATASDSEERIFTLTGIEVTGNDCLAPGIYIVTGNGRAVKVVR